MSHVLMKTCRCLWIVILVMGLAGCGSMGPSSRSPRSPQGVKALPKLPKTSEMTTQFTQAEKVFMSRNFSQAKIAYNDYLQAFPYNAYTPKTYFRLGEISMAEKDYAKAKGYYEKSVEKGIFPEWGQGSLYKLAIVSAKLGDKADVFNALDKMRLPSSNTDTSLSLRAASLRVNTALKFEEYLEEKKGYLEVFDAYQRQSQKEKSVEEANWIIRPETANDELKKWMDMPGGLNSRDEIQALQKWQPIFDDSSAGAYILRRLTILYQNQGQYADASGWAQKFLNLYPKDAWAGEARRFLVETDKRGETPSNTRATIGVLLPLTGKYAVYGESVLHGIECAAGIFPPCHSDSNINLAIRDTKGDPATAAAFLEELSRDPKVSAVIGPLPSAEIDSVTAMAEKVRMPLMTLSQKPDVPQKGAYVFRNFLTVTDQVATLVEHVCRDKKIKKYAILYPAGATGETYAQSFAEEVSRCGGKILGKASYSEKSTSFADALRQLKFSGNEVSQDRAVDFDALFFPDVYRRLPQLVQDMKLLAMEGFILMGGAGWNHPSLADVAVDLEGAVFVDGFSSRSNRSLTREFAQIFKATYDFEPTLLEAYGYDSLRILENALGQNVEVNRDQLQQALLNGRSFNGVTGDITLDEEGDARHKLFLFQIEQGQIKELR